MNPVAFVREMAAARHSTGFGFFLIGAQVVVAAVALALIAAGGWVWAIEQALKAAAQQT